MRSRTLPRIHASLVAAALIVASLTTRPARAETALAGDLDWAKPINATGIDSGWGFGVRIGQYLHVPLVALTPEVGFTYHVFGGSAGPTTYRGIGGLRLGVGEVIRPGVFAHAGVGRLSLPEPVASLSYTAFTYDVGGFLDFTLLPVVNIGVHAAYNHLNAGSDSASSFQWATLGGHIAFIF